MYYFGKDNNVYFYYGADSTPYNNTPTIYLFDTYPSREDAESGSGALQTIASWTDSDRELCKLVTVQSFNDPVPESATYYKEYFLAFNYILESSGDTVTKIQELIFTRPNTKISRFNVTVNDLYKTYPALKDFVSEDQLEDFLKNGIDEIRLDFIKRGIDWETVSNSRLLKWAIIYKAIANSQLAQFTDPTDKFYARYQQYEAKYREAIEGDIVNIDSDKDGREEHGSAVKQGFSINIR